VTDEMIFLLKELVTTLVWRINEPILLTPLLPIANCLLILAWGLSFLHFLFGFWFFDSWPLLFGIWSLAFGIFLEPGAWVLRFFHFHPLNNLLVAACLLSLKFAAL
jgi:hypothetical protein